MTWLLDRESYQRGVAALLRHLIGPLDAASHLLLDLTHIQDLERSRRLRDDHGGASNAP